MEKKNCERVVNNVTEEVKYANIFGQHCFSWTICHPFHNGTPVTKALLNVGVKTSNDIHVSTNNTHKGIPQ